MLTRAGWLAWNTSISGIVSNRIEWRTWRWTISERWQRATRGMPVCCPIKHNKFIFSLCSPQLIESFTSLTKLKKQLTDHSLRFARIITTCWIAWIDRTEMAGSMLRCFCITVCFLAACNLEDAVAPIYLPADGESLIEIGHAMPLVTAGHGTNMLYPFYLSYCFPSMWSPWRQCINVTSPVYFFVSTYWIHPGSAATLSFKALLEPVTASEAPTSGPSFAPTIKPSVAPTAIPTMSASALQAQISKEGDAVYQLVSAQSALISGAGLWKALTVTALHSWLWLQSPASIFVSLSLIKGIANKKVLTFNLTVHFDNIHLHCRLESRSIPCTYS